MSAPGTSGRLLRVCLCVCVYVCATHKKTKWKFYNILKWNFLNYDGGKRKTDAVLHYTDYVLESENENNTYNRIATPNQTIQIIFFIFCVCSLSGSHALHLHYSHGLRLLRLRHTAHRYTRVTIITLTDCMSQTGSYRFFCFSNSDPSLSLSLSIAASLCVHRLLTLSGIMYVVQCGRSTVSLVASGPQICISANSTSQTKL